MQTGRRTATERLPIEQAALEEIAEHCRRLYDEETARMVRINEGARLDRVILGAVLGLAAAVRLPIHAILPSTHDHTPSQGTAFIGAALLLFGGLALVISCVYTFRVLMVREYQRPSDPKVFFARSSIIGTKADVLLRVISDYAVAANHNHTANNFKVRTHSRAVWWLMVGMVSAFMGLCICSVINATK
jgi:hypothetical protein